MLRISSQTARSLPPSCQVFLFQCIGLLAQKGACLHLTGIPSFPAQALPLLSRAVAGKGRPRPAGRTEPQSRLAHNPPRRGGMPRRGRARHRASAPGQGARPGPGRAAALYFHLDPSRSAAAAPPRGQHVMSRGSSAAGGGLRGAEIRREPAAPPPHTPPPLRCRSRPCPRGHPAPCRRKNEEGARGPASATNTAGAGGPAQPPGHCLPASPPPDGAPAPDHFP